MNDSPSYKPWVLGGILVVAMIIAIIGFFGSFTTIDTGHVGVVTKNGAITGESLGPGFHIIEPFVESVVDFDTRVQKYTSEVLSGKTSDSQVVTNTMVVNYSIVASKAPSIYQAVGTNYADVLITHNALGAFSAAVAKFNSDDLAKDLTTVAETTTTILTAKLNSALVNASSDKIKLGPGDITIIGVNFISSFGFSAQYNDSIERKQIAQQNVLTASQTLAQKRIDAQQQVVAAQAEAQAQVARAQADATSTLLRAEANAKAQALQARSITPAFLQLTALQRWNGQLPTYNTGGSIPFLSILPTPATPGSNH